MRKLVIEQLEHRGINMNSEFTRSGLTHSPFHLLYNFGQLLDFFDLQFFLFCSGVANSPRSAE